MANISSLSGDHDPVFSLIEAERRAWTAFITAPDGTSDKFGAAAIDALHAVIWCEPTTPAGVAAMVDTYVARNGDDWIGDPDVMRLLGLASAFLSATTASEAATRSGEA